MTTSVRFPGVTVALFSENKKTGPCHVLYVTQETCPGTCPHRHNGCYAEQGNVGIISKRLNSQSDNLDHTEIAHNIMCAIDATPATADLRLFGVGDAHCALCAGVIASAARRYIKRGKGRYRVWGYTHNWYKVPAKVWHGINMLASCETPTQAAVAMDAGYAAAIVTPSHMTRSRYAREDIDILPCPQQTHAGITCTSCRLCLDTPSLLGKRMVIGFEAHGTRKGRVLHTLEVLNNA